MNAAVSAGRARVAAAPGIAPDLLAEVIGVLDVGVAVAGPDGRLVLVNRAVPELLGLVGQGRLADPLGMTLSEIAEALTARGAPALAAALSWPPPPRPQQLCLPDGRSVQAAWHRLEPDAPGEPGDGGWVLVVRDVTLQSQVRRRLREHNRALAQKVAEKTELVSALCHELRTPLTSTSTMLELMPDAAAAAGVGELLDVVRRNAARIGDVVDELSTLNALEQGQVELDVRPVPLDGLLREAVARWNAREPAAAPVTLAVDGEPRATIAADPAWLAALFERLLSVAVASAGDAPVRVTATAGPDGWLVRLPLHEQLTSNRLFTATGGARTSTALMLARAVVARHGGTLRTATAGGGGAIELRLPREGRAGPRQGQA
ncbi:HAMP domain-containing sensor histidine kinase [Dactylosporangium sp. NPDC000555]|uniref:HAMP domain-containing sensor histidine kinase n=1 Tax=Dactylosporangium sp. NPDC000555 TaxID=3154260 RepID=UPI00332E070E